MRVFVSKYPGNHFTDMIPILLTPSPVLKNMDYDELCRIAGIVKEVIKKDKIIMFTKFDIYDDFMFDDEHESDNGFEKSRIIQLHQQGRIDENEKETRAKKIYNLIAPYFKKVKNDVILTINIKRD